MKPIIIIGAGKHSRVLIETLKNNGRKILGVTDLTKKSGEDFCGVKILGSDEIIFKYHANKIELVNGIGELNHRQTRYNLSKKFRREGYKFAKIIHPSAVISNKVELDDGVQIMAGVVLQCGVKIGFCSIINTGAIIDHDCIISDFCHIAPGVTISGNVSVGPESHLSTSTIVIEKKKIGKNCIIGAGSVIFCDVLPNTKLIQLKKNILENLI